jgi:hypothetical protein
MTLKTHVTPTNALFYNSWLLSFYFAYSVRFDDAENSRNPTNALFYNSWLLSFYFAYSMRFDDAENSRNTNKCTVL